MTSEERKEPESFSVKTGRVSSTQSNVTCEESNSTASTGILSDQELAERFIGFTVIDRHGNETEYGDGYRFETNFDSDELYVYAVPRETWKTDNLVAIYRDWSSLHLNDTE